MSVVFDQLRVSDSGDALYIDLHVNEASVFDDFYLDTLTITTAAIVKDVPPVDPPTSGYIYKLTFTGNQKEVSLVLDKGSFDTAFATPTEEVSADTPYTSSNLSSDLFIVYAHCKRTTSADIPCELSNLTTVGITFDTKKLYQKAMAYTKELANTCEVSKGFVDFILQWNAFKAAVDTGHYTAALKFYRMLFSNVTTTGTAKPCGCHG